MKALVISLLVCGLSSCSECGARSGHATPGPPASEIGGTRTIAELDGPIDALAGTSGALYGVSGARGVVFSVTTGGEGGGAVREIATGEKEPFALVVRAREPVWASREGVFVCDPDGRERRQLVKSDSVRALGEGPHGIVFADATGLFRIEWPQAARAIRIAQDLLADEVVATDEAVVWLDRGDGSAWSLDLKSGKRTRLAENQRKPHDLSLDGDGRSVSWHEGEADLLPGRGPRAFLVDTVSGAFRALPGEYDSAAKYLVRTACVFGPAVCKPVARVDWTRLDAGGEGGLAPVADDADRFYWVGQAGARWKISGARKDLCCR